MVVVVVVGLGAIGEEGGGVEGGRGVGFGEGVGEGEGEGEGLGEGEGACGGRELGRGGMVELAGVPPKGAGD